LTHPSTNVGDMTPRELPGRAVQLVALVIVGAGALFARAAIGPLQETIRQSLSLSDNQMALLQGSALAIPLLVAGMAIGLWIDRGSRVALLFAATFLNCVATFCAAWASGFISLFVARCLVGLGAPAVSMAVFSLLADLFPPAQRGRATMAVSLGLLGGGALAFALGGLLLSCMPATTHAWRWSLTCMGAILLPVIATTLVLKEPARIGQVERSQSLRALLPELWKYRGIIGALLVGMALVNLADGASIVWAAPTFARHFALDPAHIGAVVAITSLAAGILGPVLGGLLADFAQRSGGPRGTMAAIAGLALLSTVAGLFAVMPSVSSTALLLALFGLCGSAISVMVVTFTVVALPNELRGICMAINYTAGAALGFGIAPLLVSLLSSSLGGIPALGESLALVCTATSLVGGSIFCAGWWRLSNADAQLAA
jgi:MFS family permease